MKRPGWRLERRAPNHGHKRAAEIARLAQIGPLGVRSIWLRNDLATMKDRLKALEARMAQQRMILTEAQHCR
jgi:hypothetical protein